MRGLGRAVIAAAALMLTGCLWGPGKFASDLILRKNGTFVLDYRGEILLQLPPDKAANAVPWDAKMARCYLDGRAELAPYTMEIDGKMVSDGDNDKPRACTAAEIASLQMEYQKKTAEQAAAKRKESEEMAKLFGLPGSDDSSNRKFAANLMKYRGWKSVVYKSKGVFDVDYHVDGRVDQDFAFPLMPDTDMVIPFILIRQRTDGSVMVTAPGLAGGTGPFAARAKAMGMPGSEGGPVSRAQGRFTITTDGEILTNNSEDGPAVDPAGRRVVWDIGPASARSPEMLVRM